jgi:hypothetical protein
MSSQCRHRVQGEGQVRWQVHRTHGSMTDMQLLSPVVFGLKSGAYISSRNAATGGILAPAAPPRLCLQARPQRPCCFLITMLLVLLLLLLHMQGVAGHLVCGS